MIAIIRPVLLSFLGSKAVKRLVIELLEAFAKRTDNTLDDQAVEVIRKNLL